MISIRTRITFFLAAILLILPTFAGSSRATALSRVRHGAIVSGDPTPLSKSVGKPVVLYYWDITCIPCYAHLDDIIDFALDVERTGGRFFSIHHGMKQTADTLRQFATKQKIPYTIARGGSGPAAVRALPRMFVFNTKGDLVYQGSIGKLAVDAYKAQIKPK